MQRHHHRLALAVVIALVGCGGDKDSAGPPEGNTPPEVFITSHVDGASVFDRQQLDMTGTVSDREDESTALLVSWAQGGTVICPEQAPTSEGNTACNITIDYNGSREVSLTVKDTAGSSSLARITFDIVDSEPPTIDIEEPIPGEPYSQGSPVRFLAQVTDPDNDPSQLTVVWDSNIQGELTIDAPNPDGLIDAMVALVEGDHRIQVAVSDPEGNVTEEALFLAVGP